MDAAFESGHGDDETERDDGSLADLVLGAQRDDAAAWQELIERFTPLVVAITRGYRLSVEDAQDVNPARWDLCGGRPEPEGEGPSLPRLMPAWM